MSSLICMCTHTCVCIFVWWFESLQSVSNFSSGCLYIDLFLCQEKKIFKCKGKSHIKGWALTPQFCLQILDILTSVWKMVVVLPWSQRFRVIKILMVPPRAASATKTVFAVFCLIFSYFRASCEYLSPLAHVLCSKVSCTCCPFLCTVVEETQRDHEWSALTLLAACFHTYRDQEPDCCLTAGLREYSGVWLVFWGKLCVSVCVFSFKSVNWCW